MNKFLTTFAVASALVSPALADENDFPLETVRAYAGASFEVNVPCVERAVRDFLGTDLSKFNSEVGVISGRNGQAEVIVILSGERAESDLAFVEGVVLNRGSESSSINHSGLNGSFMTLSSPNNSNILPVEHNVQNFEAYIQSCRPAMLLS